MVPTRWCTFNQPVLWRLGGRNCWVALHSFLKLELEDALSSVVYVKTKWVTSNRKLDTISIQYMCENISQNYIVLSVMAFLFCDVRYR